MQTEVSTLPIVYSDGDEHLTRKEKKGISRVSSLESKIHAQCNNITPFLVFNRKHLNPILGGPYRDSMRMHCQSGPVRVTTTHKNLLGQRILSAKVLRVKELQNQISDAHYHLNELAIENRLLKVLQKRQDTALKRYEGTNAELPRIINSHQEELKALQTKYKQLKFQHKQTCSLLKEKESDIHSLQNQNKHLLKLSKDQQLGEREKLQIQVSDLNHEIQQHHKTIQTLNRKLTLQSKKFKHQLNSEVTKHRETRKQLHITIEKLKTLEDLLNNREKRLYSNPLSHQLPLFNHRKPMTSQSLTNLRNNSGTTNLVKTSGSTKNCQGEIKTESLPKLNMKELNDSGKLSSVKAVNTLDIVNVSETMTSFEHVRKFRLQKSAKSRHSSSYASDENDMRDKLEVDMDSAINDFKMNSFSQSIVTKNIQDDKIDMRKLENLEINDIVNNFNTASANINEEYDAPEKLRRQYGILSDNSDLSDDEIHTDDEIISPTSNSKYLHTRLINATVDKRTSSDEETFHDMTIKKSKVLKKRVIDEIQKSYNNSEISHNTLRINQKQFIDHDNISLSEFSHLDINGIASYSKINHEDINDDKKKSITPRRNSINNSCDKFDTNNEETFKNGIDLWTKLRERLNGVQEKNSDHPRSTFDSIDMLPLKNNPISNLELETKNSETSDELLHYFNMDENNYTLSKPTSSPQKPITNGFISRFENDETSLSISEEKNKNISRLNVSDTNNIQKLKVEQQSENQEDLNDVKTKNFNKHKLLAAMKAIDNNENIDLSLDKKKRETNNSIRSQVTENLYRGLPTHARKRDEIIKDIFSDTKIESKLYNGCRKLH